VTSAERALPYDHRASFEGTDSHSEIARLVFGGATVLKLGLDTGLFDETHLRFFTRASLRELLVQHGRPTTPPSPPPFSKSRISSRAQGGRC
jgi:hypothetical protein